jgi:hypothetical protein
MNKLEFQLQSHIYTFKKNSQAFTRYLSDSLINQDERIIEKTYDPDIQFRLDLKILFSTENGKEEKYYNLKLPHIISNSILISSFSLFEYYFKRLANTVRIRWPKNNSYNCKWKNINYYKDTIYNITKYNYDSLNGFWGEINSARKIRNLLVHHGSTVRMDVNKKIKDQPDYRHLKNHKKINLSDETGYFTITDPSIIDDFFHNANKYLDGVYEIIQKNDFGRVE